jgi:phosphatidate phosphatase APP1
VRFTLVGDDTEHDPEVFEEVRRRYADRIDAIWMRHVSADARRVRFVNQLDLADLIELHVDQTS